MNIVLVKFYSLILLSSLLQGCIVPQFDHASFDNYYAVPLDAEKPWLSLSNGLELHAYSRCSDAEMQPKCDMPGFLVVDRAQKPDWSKIGSFDVSVWHPGKLKPILSAHANTTYRVIGVDEGKFGKIYLLRSGFVKRDSHPLKVNSAGIVEINLYSNAPCRVDDPVPRLVVFDDENIWIFAENDSGCRSDLPAGFSPRSIFNFDGGDQFDVILRTPMMLFYISGSLVGQSDFGQPRMVLRDVELPKGSTRRAMRLSEVVQPMSTMFRLELSPALPILSVPDHPNFYCHYSDTIIGFRLVWAGENAKPSFKYCRPYHGK
ncbi:hypothetical protein [Janthinobacterium sp. RB2R34]|uniref:hypothetical protein n=1 Tax=Janthinobacterium sp. RB2R34 TaxID=3424193 RepID=UPI003F24E8AD